MEGPVASGSRHVLNDIQPGQGAGESRHPCAQGQHYPIEAVSDRENFFSESHPHGPAERRHQRSKANRKEPYDQKKKGTRRGKTSSSTASDLSDPEEEEEEEYCPHQAIVCPYPVGQYHCGVLVNSAKAMFKHLKDGHLVSPLKTESANAHLGGRCPLVDICDDRMKGGSIHRHVMEHFFHFICMASEWGCGATYARCYDLKRHCRGDHNMVLPGKVLDYAVRKKEWN
ncbi:hypothetical protein M413DRAFT_449759 [Hebeloma cylindrosporum]|uniref:Uncharacterized protein n=1 Tax=Hebeloma cylindrosporum TaxID=76867 RepID=A0A0C2Y304_HEBCY|nr:hypothetical protein M413DRAFT_449759 [Hebeloma cylindrosporum h7]